MRELGRLLLNLKMSTGLTRLFDVMKPQFFIIVVPLRKLLVAITQKRGHSKLVV